MRNIEIIGQAVKDFGTEELATRNASIPWKQVAGMRDMLAHRYLGVDIEMTWEVVERGLEPVNATIEKIAAELGLHLPVYGSRRQRTRPYMARPIFRTGHRARKAAQANRPFPAVRPHPRWRVR